MSASSAPCDVARTTRLDPTARLLRSYLVAVNGSLPAVNLTVTVSPLGIWKWQIYQQMEKTFQMQRSMGTVRTTVSCSPRHPPHIGAVRIAGCEWKKGTTRLGLGAYAAQRTLVLVAALELCLSRQAPRTS